MGVENRNSFSRKVEVAVEKGVGVGVSAIGLLAREFPVILAGIGLYLIGVFRGRKPPAR